MDSSPSCNLYIDNPSNPPAVLSPSVAAEREGGQQADDVGNHSEGRLPDGAEQDTEKQWFREAQADVCKVSMPSFRGLKRDPSVFG